MRATPGVSAAPSLSPTTFTTKNPAGGPQTAFGEVRATRGPGSRPPFSDLRSASALGVPQKRPHKCFGCSRFQVGRIITTGYDTSMLAAAVFF